MADSKDLKQLVITIDHRGDCSLIPPEDTPWQEVFEILTAAIDVTAQKLEKLEESSAKAVHQEYLYAKKKGEVLN